MHVNLSRLYLIALILASAALFCIPSDSIRQYAMQSFLIGDASFQFYDDFTANLGKPVWIFKLLLAAVIFMLYKLTNNEKGLLSNKTSRFVAYLTGAALILTWWPLALIVVLILGIISYPWYDHQILPQKNRWILGLLFLTALLFRMEKLPNTVGQKLQPDPTQFVALSQDNTWFYDTRHREPLWAWVNGLISCVWPIPEDFRESGYLPIRIVSILLSCCCVLAAFAFGKRWISHQAGFTVALLMALDKALMYRSLQGLRLEILMLGLFALLWLSWSSTKTKNLFDKRTIALGLIGAALLLIRTSCLPIVVFSFLWAWGSGKQSWKQIGIAGLICMIPVLPYYIYCWQTYGDPLYSGNCHIKFYYNAVFGQNPPDGQRITPMQMMLVVFPWYKSVFHTMMGTIDAYFGEKALKIFYLPLSPMIIGASVIGYFRWIIDRKRWIFLINLLLMLGPMAFFLGILGTHFDWRLVAHLMPLMAFASFEGLRYLLISAKWIQESECGD